MLGLKVCTFNFNYVGSYRRLWAAFCGSQMSNLSFARAVWALNYWAISLTLPLLLRFFTEPELTAARLAGWEVSGVWQPLSPSTWCLMLRIRTQVFIFVMQVVYGQPFSCPIMPYIYIKVRIGCLLWFRLHVICFNIWFKYTRML